MNDPYKVLGVRKDADADDIKKAYRKLAKQLHPDLNPGDEAVEQRFKEVSQAYSILGDSEKRKRFDRGEIDGSGQDKGPSHGGFYREYARSGGGGGKYRSYDFGFDQASDDIFSDLFRRRAARDAGSRTVRRRGADVSYKVEVDLEDAARGAKKRIVLADGKALDVSIPPGTESGQTLRLRAKGMSGLGGAPAGDALIEVQVNDHKFFVRDGNDIRIELPVTLQEAVVGATIEVPTLQGKVSMKVPAGSNTGTLLRLKGKGVAPRGDAEPGDQYVTLRVVLPDDPGAEFKDFIERWAKDHDYDPRRKAGLT